MGISWLNQQLRAADVAHRLAAALAASRAERLDAINNTTVDGIIVVDPKGTIEPFNRGAQRLFGYPESEVMGRNISMLLLGVSLTRSIHIPDPALAISAHPASRVFLPTSGNFSALQPFIGVPRNVDARRSEAD
jgi:PAS domain-containing protein